ncbi:MAG: anti-sigma factor [Pseudomonadota bacterium]
MRQTPNTPDEEDALAAEFVVGVLPRAERPLVERRIFRDTAFADRVARWEVRLAGLNEDYGHLVPPMGVKARIDRRLFGAPRSTRAGWGWIAGAATAVAMGVFVLIWQDATVTGSDLRAALDGDTITFAVNIDRNRDLLNVTPASDAVPDGSVYQIWLVPDGMAPVSLGLVTADGQLPIGTELAAGDTLAVSIEPAGGSPIGAPTGPIIAIGVLEDV